VLNTVNGMKESIYHYDPQFESIIDDILKELPSINGYQDEYVKRRIIIEFHPTKKMPFLIWYLDQSKETLYLYHPDINKWQRKEGVSTQAWTYEAIKAGRALEKPKTIPLRKGWGVLVDKMTEANNHQCIH